MVGRGGSEFRQAAQVLVRVAVRHVGAGEKGRARRLPCRGERCMRGAACEGTGRDLRRRPRAGGRPVAITGVVLVAWVVAVLEQGRLLDAEPFPLGVSRPAVAVR
jgi:hypothetical protein